MFFLYCAMSQSNYAGFGPGQAGIFRYVANLPFKFLKWLVFYEYMLNYPGNMLGYNCASRLLTVSALYFIVVLKHRSTFLDSRYSNIHKIQFQIAITILAAGFMSSVISTVLAAGCKPTITGKLPVRRKPF